MARPLNEFGITEQQEKFCLAYVETGNASESYRRSYSTERMNVNTIARRASEMLDNGKVTARIAMLREVHTKRHNVTVDSLVAELEQIKQVALAAENPQSSAAVAAVMGKAKLMGLDKQLVEVSGGMNNTVTVATKAEMFKELYGED